MTEYLACDFYEDYLRLERLKRMIGNFDAQGNQKSQDIPKFTTKASDNGNINNNSNNTNKKVDIGLNKGNTSTKQKEKDGKFKAIPIIERNPRRAMAKLAREKTKLAKLNESERKEIESKLEWEKAKLRAKGIKLKDNEQLLKKSIKRKRKRPGFEGKKMVKST